MRVVMKVGTNLVTKPDHSLDTDFLRQLVDQIASLFKEGEELLLVTSGAVAAGRGEVEFDRERANIPVRQALAAIGQSKLMGVYHDLFAEYGISVAQALLTNEDFARRESFLNTQGVFELLLRQKIIPIVNENDVTAISELTMGDNDMLSAKTSTLVSADFLILLTTVDGLYTDDPRKNPNAKHIRFVLEADKKLFEYAREKPSPGSLGGMKGKLEAAFYAMSSGIGTLICDGRKSEILREAVNGFRKYRIDERAVLEFPGTFFSPKKGRQENLKKWLRMKVLKGAKLGIDVGAMRALRQQGKSLLPSGIRQVSGTFKRGDVVTVVTESGEIIGYGQVNYGSEEAREIMGKKSSEIEGILGYSLGDEVIHRNLLLLD